MKRIRTPVSSPPPDSPTRVAATPRIYSGAPIGSGQHVGFRTIVQTGPSAFQDKRRSRLGRAQHFTYPAQHCGTSGETTSTKLDIHETRIDFLNILNLEESQNSNSNIYTTLYY